MDKITVSIIKDGDWFVSHCLEYDIASQGRSRCEARENIIEAVNGFLEVASPDEIRRRLESRGEVEYLSLDSALTEGTVRERDLSYSDPKRI